MMLILCYNSIPCFHKVTALWKHLFGSYKDVCGHIITFLWHAFGNIRITEHMDSRIACNKITDDLFMKSGLDLGSSEVDELANNIKFQQ